MIFNHIICTINRTIVAYICKKVLCHLAEHSVRHNQTAKGLFQHLTALYLMIAYSTKWCKKRIRLMALNYHKNIIQSFL